MGVPTRDLGVPMRKTVRPRKRRGFLTSLFMAKVEPVTECGCWIWMGATRGDGYGSFSIMGQNFAAHRYAYSFFSGCEIPKERHVLHRCDMTLCVNPDHLFLGTHAQNMADSSRKGRKVGRTGTRLTIDQAADICASTLKHAVIAKQFGISRATVGNIKSGRTWPELDRPHVQGAAR